jgi:hypothetical protein
MNSCYHSVHIYALVLYLFSVSYWIPFPLHGVLNDQFYIVPSSCGGMFINEYEARVIKFYRDIRLGTFKVRKC